MTATRDQFFKPGKMATQSKAELSDSAAKQIMAAEVAAREKKTEKLRALRLAQPVVEAPAKKGRAK
ncbi:hypothetical protein [Rhizobium halophytocola]|uniref:Transcriptional regulator n=1 Tax=Rhizobium halophytocola TaxID=735519 RepID=A0ABS4E5V6_9HYPH|nr:hypothetical protein [Rhizobium halophytocola]MBP1853330.1 hypothetical protein [Rhizobium halophytocola]